MRKTTELKNLELIDELHLKEVSSGKVLDFASKSDMMRFLWTQNVSIADIQRFLNVHYSFVYGVISRTFDIEKSTNVTKSDEIRKLASNGLTVGQIAKQLNANYSFVFSVVKKYKESIAK